VVTHLAYLILAAASNAVGMGLVVGMGTTATSSCPETVREVTRQIISLLTTLNLE